MISIRNLIAASNSNIRAEQEIQRDTRVSEIHKKYPELEKVDNQIVAARATRFIAVLDDNNVEQSHSENLEKQLLDKKSRILARYDIDPGYEDLKVICSRCGDTGYFTNKKGMNQVCPCRQDVIEDCYRKSGMADYSLVKLNNYKDDYFGDGPHRASLRKKISEIIIGSDTEPDHTLWVLSDGVQTGKTFLAVYSLKLAVNLAKSVYYLRLDDLMKMYDDDLDDLRDCDILIVDDYIANMTVTGNVGTKLNSILETRQATGLATIIVTSFDISSIVAESDVRISGKLKNAGLINSGKTGK